MQVKCEYCGAYINDTDQFCSHCGAVNDGLKRSSDGTPKTIEELQKWYEDRKLPPKETTRFFIGEDYKGARAFGIYKKEDQFVVYKNKDDGSRAIRYEGPDEAYAVNEIFLKLKSEILNQKAHNINSKTGKKEETIFDKIKDGVFGIALIIIVFGFVITTIMSIISNVSLWMKV